MEPKLQTEDAMAEWEDGDEAPGHDDFYDDLAHLYLVSGGVWPEGIALDNLPGLEASLCIADFFEDLSPELEK